MHNKVNHRLCRVRSTAESKGKSELNPLILGIASFAVVDSSEKKDREDISRRDFIKRLKSTIKKVGFAALPIIAISSVGCGDSDPCRCENKGSCACDLICTCEAV